MSDWTRAIARLQESADRTANVAAVLTDEQWRGPSGLPGWSRAHVAAHIALNAEGLVRALATRTLAAALPVYDSNAARETDIESLAASTRDEVVRRMQEADAELAALLTSVPAAERSGSVPRTPGGPVFVIDDIPITRRRELEVHLIDLDAGVGRSTWPEDFVTELLDRTTWDHHDDGPFVVRAEDLGRSWQVGEGEGPTVTGPGAELAWWLTGRPGADLPGDLPPLSPWVRRPGA